MAKTLQVGIIGASAERGWAKVAHVPAVQGLAGLDFGAVAMRDRPSAEKVGDFCVLDPIRSRAASPENALVCNDGRSPALTGSPKEPCGLPSPILPSSA